ncbi:AarF domain-containing protein kinase [Acrasis kona]|uniref:AarF domain-containing protein kinase n=1 Tax=Acrasis kona TaxID=1008807 RepID=A0AAW2ZD75_9EUKA
MKITDLWRVTQGISSIVRASVIRGSRQTQNASSKITFYPESPLKSANKVLKTAMRKPPTQYNTEKTQPNVQTTSADTAQQQQPTIIYFNTFGNEQHQSSTQIVVPQSELKNSGTTIVFNQDPANPGEQKIEVKSSTKMEDTIVVNTSFLQQDPLPEVAEEKPTDVSNIVKDEAKEQIPIPEVPIIENPILDNPTQELKEVVEEQVPQKSISDKVQDLYDNPAVAPSTPSEMRTQKVPSSSFGRAFGFTTLGFNLLTGTLSNYVKKKVSGDQATLRSSVMTEANAEQIASTLCKMRGAALKLGQMLSLQEDSVVPPVIRQALERVRQSADVMPESQMMEAMTNELGVDWNSQFTSFDKKPIAAASIGQVHRGTILDGTDVAIKIQYPGVSQSIDSDIKNVKLLLKSTNMMPKGAYIHSTLEQARNELSSECDYVKEANNQIRYANILSQASSKDDDLKTFVVPKVIPHLSTSKVLTTEFAHGVTVDKLSSDPEIDQSTRNKIALQLLKLCLKELFEFRFMQTDPNWSNYIYDKSTQKLQLIDFGACMEFPKTFVDQYIRVVNAAATNDIDTIIDASIKMGFLTGEEPSVMMEAHAQAVTLLGEPFSAPGVYDFKNKQMPKKVASIIPTMLKYRLTPPPPVTYSLHRKLSGAVLLCHKLDAKIECRDIFMDIYNNYEFEK